MTNSQPSTADIISELATKVTGWKKRRGDEGYGYYNENNEWMAYHTWNPTIDWNHWRQIEERLMEDGKSKLLKEFMKQFDGKFDYMGSTLEERCYALAIALRAISSSSE